MIAGLIQVVCLRVRIVGAPDVQQPAQLGQRFRGILHAEVDDAVLPGLPRAGARDDEHRRRLPAAYVPALRLGRIESGHQPVGEGRVCRFEHCRHGAPDGVPLHQVGLAAETVAEPVAGGWNAFRAGVRGHVAGRVDDGALAEIGVRIPCRQRFQRLFRGVAGLQQLEPQRAVADVDVGLSCHGTNAGKRPGHDRPDLEVVGLHRHTELAGSLVAGHYRVGHSAPYGSS